MEWREMDNIKGGRNEGGNGVEAYVARVTDDKFAWNVRRRGGILAHGYSRSLGARRANPRGG